MNCPRCGFEQHIGATFCPNCGWLLTSAENPDDFWRIQETPSPMLWRVPKRRKRKPSPQEEPPPRPDLKRELEGTTRPREDAAPAEVSVRAEETAGQSRGAEAAEDRTPAPPEVPSKAEQMQPTPSDYPSPAVPLQPLQDFERPIMEGPGQSSQPPGEPPATPQAPAVARGESFAIRPPAEKDRRPFLLVAAALLVGFLLGAVAQYILSPPKEYIVLEPQPTPSPAVEPRPIGGLAPLPVPRTSPGPIPAPGPDLPAQNDLRNALIAQKKHYARAGQYTSDIEVLQKEAPHVVWEPGVTPSRPGVVAVMVCGSDPSAAVLLQAIGATGRFYGIYDVPSGPFSSVYYATSQQSFSCPNSAPPPSPWKASLAGWGIQQPVVEEPTPSGPGPEPAPPSDEDVLGGSGPTPAPLPAPLQTPIPSPSPTVG